MTKVFLIFSRCQPVTGDGWDQICPDMTVIEDNSDQINTISYSTLRLFLGMLSFLRVECPFHVCDSRR